MNSQYLEKMLSSMDSFERYESSSHMPAGILVPIEQELLLGQTYVAKKPHITTGSALERTGIIRRIREPINAVYNGMRLRIGKTTLHVKEPGAEGNVESVVMVLMQDMQAESIGGATAHTATDGVLAVLHDNGVVSGCYIQGTGHAYVNSWFPEGRKGAGGWPYPASKEDVEAIFSESLGRGGIIWNRVASRVPDLVMLGVKTHTSGIK